MGGWPWEWTREALELLPELAFLRDWHVTQAGILAASAMGAKIDRAAHELMHPGSVPEALRGAQRRELRLRLPPAQAAAFRKALALGFVSQRLLNYYAEG